MTDNFKDEIRSRAQSGPVDQAISRLKDWGATSINTVDTTQSVSIDFNTPFPGKQPIHSTITLKGGEVVESVIRYGVLDKNALGGTPTPAILDEAEPPEINRLKAAVNKPIYPGSLRVAVDFGDGERTPRPHVRVGTPTSGVTVHEGVNGEPTPLLDYLNWVKLVGEEIREEFDSEFVQTVPGLRNAPRFITNFADRVGSEWDVESANPSSITNTELNLTKTLGEATVEFNEKGEVVKLTAVFDTSPLAPEPDSDEQWQQTVDSVDMPPETTAFVTDRTAKRKVNWDSARAGDTADPEQIASALNSLAIRT